jgi:PAS domain S-box-containing protein
MDDIVKNGQLKAIDLAERVGPEFLSAHEAKLLPFLQSAQEQTGAVYAAAIGLDGLVLAHTNVGEKGQHYLDADTRADLNLQRPDGHPSTYRGTPIMEVAVPVWSHTEGVSGEDFMLTGEKTASEKTRLGVVRLGLPIEPALEKERLLFRQITIMVFIFGGLSLFVLLVVVRRILSPIQWLSLATARVAQGDYGGTVPISSKDELGALGLAFNEMSKVLAETTVSKKSLEESQQRLLEAQRVAHLGSYHSAANRSEVWWSEEVYQIFGLDPQKPAPAGDNQKALFTPDSWKQYLSLRAEAIQSGKPYVIDLEIIRPDGSHRWITLRGEPQRGGDGRVVEIRGTAQDITERKQSEQQRMLLFTAIEQSRDSIVITNSEGTIQYVNRAFEIVSGYSRYEAIGQKPSLLKSGKHGEAFYKSMWQTIEAGNVWEGILINKRKDGNEFEEEANICPIINDAGVITNYVAVKRNITERRKMELIVRQSEKMSAVGQLAAGVAHEINNPLGVILGFAQALVRRLQANDPLEMPLKSIEREAVRCKNLVQDLLTFSRASKMEREPMQINRAVEGALSLISAQARMGRIEVKKDLAPDLPRIMANQNQLQQIIINLANNAMDAMSQEGVLTISTEHLREGALSWVCLKVLDTGSGIPADIQSRIFDPFFTTKPVGKGTGLGLSLVHEIVQKHSGSVEVHSRPGHTEFVIKFPVHSTDTPEIASSGGQP